MNKEGILKEIKNSNLTEECKTEVIQIIEQYDKNRVEEILPLLFKLIEIASRRTAVSCYGALRSPDFPPADCSADDRLEKFRSQGTHSTRFGAFFQLARRVFPLF